MEPSREEFMFWTKRHHLVDDQTQSQITSDALSQAMGLGHSDGREFSQSNLVSDSQAGHLNAQIQDPNLINPWGVAFSPTGSPFWVNNNHTGTATVYDVDP